MAKQVAEDGGAEKCHFQSLHHTVVDLVASIPQDLFTIVGTLQVLHAKNSKAIDSHVAHVICFKHGGFENIVRAGMLNC